MTSELHRGILRNNYVVKEIMAETKKHLSRRVKIILATIFILVAVCLLVLGLWFARNALFHENPRFVVREIQLTCDSGYWRGKTEDERLRKTEEFAREFGIHYKTDLQTNTFNLDLAALRKRILMRMPEVRTIEIRRHLPDMLSFDIRSRIPRVDIGKGYYLDDDGTVLDARYYDLPKRSLPFLNEFPDNLKDLTRGGKVTSSAVLTALKFVRIIDTSDDDKIRRIKLNQIICINKPGNRYTQCMLAYPSALSSARNFRIEIPFEISDLEFRMLFERLIPALDAALKTANHSRVIDLRYKGPAFSPQP